MAQLVQQSLGDLWVPSSNLGLDFCGLTAYRGLDNSLSPRKKGKSCHPGSNPVPMDHNATADLWFRIWRVPCQILNHLLHYVMSI
jgi:hypothetical protein